MSEFNMRVDLAPYTPDLFIKDKIYQSMDKVDYSSYISINSQIFVFNIICNNEETFNYYNSPDYFLYGIIKDKNIAPRTLPSTYFFNNPPSVLEDTGSFIDKKPYTIVEETNQITIPIKTLIGDIGYNINLIDEKNFYYAELECTDASLSLLTKKNVIYLFFTEKNLSKINYNNYNSTVFYEGKYRNVYIYPYINIPIFPEPEIIGLQRNTNTIENINFSKTIADKNINLIDFDDRDTIKYYEKIDYKYMEREEYYNDQRNKLTLIKYLVKNYENFEEYFIESKNENSIMISNNEISMVFFNNLDYEIKNKNSYTLRNLNNLYINTNKSLSGKDKKYSMSLDNKLAYVKKFITDTGFRYNPFDSIILNVPSIYQLARNYYINGYVNIIRYNDTDSNNLLFTINSYLYKVFLTINPLIISASYLISPDVSLRINNIFQDNNNLVFGFGTDKINLYFKGAPRFTNTYYINKYKINFRFNLNNNEIANYIIILGICFYNGENISLLNYDVTKNTDDLGYILYTNEDCSLSLNSHVYNLNRKVNIFEQKEPFLYDIKKSTFLLNYLNNNESNNANNFDNFLLTNFYTFIPNMNKIKINETNLFISNYQNATVNKVNNFIKNLLNINTNIYSFKNNSLKSKTLITYDLLYDLNLENENEKYIYNFTYFPKILQYSYMPPNINKYKVYTRFPQVTENIVTLPAGFYKAIRYTNYFPKNKFDTINKENDELVLSLNTINLYLENNFCLLIRLPNNCHVEDKFFVDLSDEGKQDYYINSNYMFNMGVNFTEIYMVLCDQNGKLYETTFNVIYAYKLFDQYNSVLDLNTLDSKYKIKINCYISSYLNFYQILFNFVLFNNYFEKESLLIKLQSITLENHNLNNLKDIVYYDYLRFNYITNLENVLNQYKNYDIEISNKLYKNKKIDTIVQKIINNLIYIFNTNKMLNMTRKIQSYLILIQNYQFEKNTEYAYLINLVNYNANECLNISLVNYDLDTNYCINNYTIQDLYGVLSIITVNTSTELIIFYITGVLNLINYSKTKITLTIEDTYKLLEELSLVNFVGDSEIVLFIQDTKKILENYTLNTILFQSIQSNIENEDNPTLGQFLLSMFPSYTELEIKILVTTLINMIKIIFLNTNKIDELMNNLRLIYFDSTLDGIFVEINNNVIKNNFIYNTSYYNDNLQINNFNFNKFMYDLITVINYFADELVPNNILDPLFEVTITYKKVKSENIITIINNTTDIFNTICLKLIGIYKLLRNINTGVIPKFDIYNEKNIGYMYYLLAIFKGNLAKIVKIFTENKIVLFTEFYPQMKYMNNFISSVSEYLYFVQLQMVFRQFNNFALIGDISYIPEDILKVLTIDEIYKIFKEILEKINALIAGNAQELINELLKQEIEKSERIILRNPNEELKAFTDIVKKYKFGTVDIYDILKSYILESFIIVNNKIDYSKIINKLDFQGQNIILLEDYNLLYDTFDYSSFNFDIKLISLINTYYSYKKSSLNYYYETKDIEFYKQLINYNYVKFGFINGIFSDI